MPTIIGLGDELVRRLFRHGSTVVIDVAILGIAFALAFALRFDWLIPKDMLRRMVATGPYIVLLQYLGLVALSVPRFSWRYFGLREVVRLGIALFATSMVLGVARAFGAYLRVEFSFSPARYAAIPYGVIAIDLVLAFVGLTGARAVRRLLGERDAAVRHDTGQQVATMVVGAGNAGLIVAKEIATHRGLGIRAVGFVDDDVAKRGTLVHGLPVLGTTHDLPGLCARHEAEQVLIAIASASGKDIRRITRICEDAGLPVKIVPGISELVAGKLELNRIREVAIEDLLRREPVTLDDQAISRAVRSKVVLVTGAGGSIGSELCRQICAFAPERLIMVERAENSLFYIHRELSSRFPDLQLVPLLVDVCDRAALDRVFRTEQPQLVFHAAAHKHVPMLEWNVDQAVLNNIVGTRNAAQVAIEHGAGAFVLVSTDKAVRPTSVMGASKRVSELLVQSLAEEGSTRFVSVRFGNVLGSAGSVVPIFKEQIAKGGPITVTHADMERYFMTIPEACQLVLQAGVMGSGGEIFILDMGEPVKIVDLARDLIMLSGLHLGEDIEIEISGIRPGEKLREELASEGELDGTMHDSILVERGRPHLQQIGKAIDDLVDAARANDEGRVRTILHELIPSFGEYRDGEAAVDGEMSEAAGRGTTQDRHGD